MPIETVTRDYTNTHASKVVDAAKARRAASEAPLTTEELETAEATFAKQFCNGFSQSDYNAIITAIDAKVKLAVNGKIAGLDTENYNAAHDFMNIARYAVQRLNTVAGRIDAVSAAEGKLADVNSETVSGIFRTPFEVAKLSEDLAELGITKEADPHNTHLKAALHKLEGVGKLDELCTRYASERANEQRNAEAVSWRERETVRLREASDRFR